MIRPGRLHRTLDRLGISTPLIELAGESFTITDDQISSVSISHGGTSPSPGIEPSTCEAVVQRTLWIKTGQNMTVKLSAAAAAAIAAHTGTIDADRIRDRYTGRIGAQSYTDRPDRLSIRFAAASWSAQLNRLRDVPRYFDAGMPVNHVLRYLVALHASLPEIDWQSYGLVDTPWMSLEETQPEGTIDNLLTQLTSDIGVLVRDTRAGVLEAWPLHYRRYWAQQEHAFQYPITRSQAISPAEWSQPNENMSAKVSAQWIDADGQLAHFSSGGTEASIVERHDWTFLRDSGDDLYTHWRALVTQQWERVMRIPSVQIDLLALLASDSPYHRGQAGYLLSLNAGDTVQFSSDWYTDLQGFHVVTGIDEKITGNSWSMNLSLVPWMLVFGDRGPSAPALTWDSAQYPWSDDTRNWNLQEVH